jgi:transcriptional regulator with XRE-family HTH domain
MDGKQFATKRKDLNWTQKQMAKELYRSIGAVRKWEHGDRPIPKSIQLLLALLKKEHLNLDLTLREIRNKIDAG